MQEIENQSIRNTQHAAIVTGASQGIGYAIAAYLAQKNYQLLLISRDSHKLAAAAENIRINTPELHHQPLISAIDVSDPKKVKDSVSDFLDKVGHVDLLCNNAGVIEHGTSKLSYEHFQKMLNINLLGAFNFIQTVSPYMKKRRQGRIINIASYSGVSARKNLGGYSASKFGLLGLNEAIYQELADYNIYVTAICPNLVWTDMTSKIGIAQDEMMQVSDVVKTIDYILSLSPSVALKNIVMQCRASLLEKNAALY